jgi:hypothetical protein
MGVAADFVYVEVIEQAELSKDDLDPLPGDERLQEEGVRVFLNPIGGQRDRVVNEEAGEVDGIGEARIDHVGVDVGSDAESIAQPAAIIYVGAGNDLVEATQAGTHVQSVSD